MKIHVTNKGKSNKVVNSEWTDSHLSLLCLCFIRYTVCWRHSSNNLKSFPQDAILFLSIKLHVFLVFLRATNTKSNKKAQLLLTNPRDAEACKFDMLTTLSMTILAYFHSFSCCCVRNLRNPEKFTENSNL